MLADRGIVRPIRPGQAGADGTRRCCAGAAARRPASSPGPLRTPRRAGDHRRARHAHLRRRSTGAPTRWRTRLVGPRGQGGRRRGDHVPQPPRLRGGHGGGGQAGRQRALPEHRVRRARSSRRSSSARSRSRSSTTRSSPTCSRRPARGASASSPGTTPSEPDDPTLEELIAGRVRRAARAAGGDAAARSSSPPGTTGTPKGANRGVARHRWTRRCRCCRRSRCSYRQTTPRRGAAVPLVGLRALHPGDAAGLHAGASPASSTPRTACALIERTRADSLVVVPVMMQRILEPARGDARAATTRRR